MYLCLVETNEWCIFTDLTFSVVKMKNYRISHTGSSGIKRRDKRAGQKIVPFLWFNGNIDEALRFYTGVFDHTRILEVHRYGDGWPGTEQKIMSATFELEGMEFMALDGGPHYAFTPAISFFVKCAGQEEIDVLWGKLTDGGEPQRCGWLRDPFGVSWQIIPDSFGELFSGSHPEKSRRAMQALLNMDKIDIAALHRAYHGHETDAVSWIH